MQLRAHNDRMDTSTIENGHRNGVDSSVETQLEPNENIVHSEFASVIPKRVFFFCLFQGTCMLYITVLCGETKPASTYSVLFLVREKVLA